MWEDEEGRVVGNNKEHEERSIREGERERQECELCPKNKYKKLTHGGAKGKDVRVKKKKKMAHSLTLSHSLTAHEVHLHYCVLSDTRAGGVQQRLVCEGSLACEATGRRGTRDKVLSL